MTPTIGRVVLYTDFDGETVWPATVVRVQDNGFLDLFVMTSYGPNSHWTVAENEHGAENTWRWPPRAPEPARTWPVRPPEVTTSEDVPEENTDGNA